MNSEGHRANILGDFNLSAVSFHMNAAGDQLYYTQLFAKTN